jgi:AcrR family transcriptional regulator
MSRASSDEALCHQFKAAVLSSSQDTPPKDPKSERIRTILNAALEEFFEQGFAAAKLDVIAERAGVGKGTVYLYFDSKEALFEEAVRNVIVPVIERIEAVALSPRGSAEDLLRIMITTFYREIVATDRRRILRLLIGEGPRFPRLLAFYHGEVISRGMSMLRGVLRYGIERGEFRQSAAIEFPQVLIGPAMAGAIWMMLFNEIDAIDLERLCEAHIDLALNGLK